MYMYTYILGFFLVVAEVWVGVKVAVEEVSTHPLSLLSFLQNHVRERAFQYGAEMGTVDVSQPSGCRYKKMN